jgi:hypothetical protein
MMLTYTHTELVDGTDDQREMVRVMMENTALRAENARLRKEVVTAPWALAAITRMRLDLETCHAALRWIVLHRDGACDGDGCWDEHREWCEWCDKQLARAALAATGGK